MSDKTRKILFFTGLALISLFAGYYIADCVQYAPWGFSDSATYLTSARNLAAGIGLGAVNPDGSFTPMQIFAPFYSFVLSLFALFHTDLIRVAGILDVILFTLLVASSGWLLYRLSRSILTSLCFAGLIAFTPVLITDFTSIMSDPLAIALGIPGFLLILLSIKENSKKMMAISAVLCGLALLTRYAFLGFCGAALLCLLILPDQPIRKRLWNAFSYGLISLLPMVLWILLQLASKSSVGSRHYTLNFSMVNKASSFFSMVFETAKYWLPYRTDMIPGLSADGFRPVLLALFTLTVLAGTGLAFSKRKSSPQAHTLWFSILGMIFLILGYLLMLLVTFFISTEQISVDDRMLSPLIPAFYGLLLLCALAVSQRLHPRLALPVVGILVALCFVAYNYHDMRTHPSTIGKFPNGYTSSVWKENPILTGEIKLPENRPLISNAPDILLFYLNRDAYYLSTAEVLTDYSVSIQDQERLTQLMSQDCALMVLFDSNTAERFEQLDYPVADADVENLISEYTSFYAADSGIILYDPDCPVQ